MKIIRNTLLFFFVLPLGLHAQVEAARSFDVYDSVGVDTHWYYGEVGGYQYLLQFSALIKLMQQAHITHFRDGEFAHGYDTPAWITSMYTQLAAGGLKGELIVANGQTLAQLESGLKAYPGVEAIEPPNEWDLNGGSSWPTTMLAQLPTISQAGKDMGLVVLGPSLTQGSSFSRLGDVAQYMDYGNMHPYNGGRNPETTGWGGGVDAEGNGYGSIAWNQDMVHEYAPGLPTYATETGYQTTSTPHQSEVPETVAGTYVPRMVMEMAKRGVKRTYFYELLDDPSYVQPGYGLLRYDLSPKPSYTALSNLLSLLEDGDTQFAPESLDYTLSGNMSGVETFLIEKSDGTFYLNVWLNGSIYDSTALKATPIAPQSLTLSVPGGMAVTDVQSFNADGTVTATAPNQSTYTVNANSCLTMIHIADAGAPAAPAAPSVDAPTFSLAGGTYTSAQSVTIADATSEAQVYYTTDNSTPTTGSKLYSGPIAVTGSETIRAIAAVAGTSSAVSSVTYTIDAPAAPAPDYSLAITPGALTLQSGASSTLQVTVTPRNGFSSAITFACSGLPAGAQCSFSPATLTPSGASASTVNLTVKSTQTPAATAMRRASGPFLPGVALAAMLWCAGWKRRRALFTVLLAIGLTAAGLLNGCSSASTGSGKTASTSPVASTVTVTATSGSVQHSTTLSLMIQ